MATLQFQIHTDKENPASAGVKTVAGGVQGVKAKSFQAHKTPRRALVSVNEANRVGLGGRTQPGPHDLKSNISLQPTALKPKNAAVLQKDSKLKGQLPDKENVQRSKQQEEKGGVRAVKAKQQQQNPVSYCLPDIEYMPPSSPPLDDDEDILPLRKRPSTYMNKLLSWRPPCFFGIVPDSDGEEEEKERQRMMDELDSLPMPADHDIFPPANLALSCEALDMDSVQLPSMDDVPLPFIDEETQQDSSDVPLPVVDEDTQQDSSPLCPELDDSVGLMPHLGSLEILDSSLPSLSQ